MNTKQQMHIALRKTTMPTNGDMDMYALALEQTREGLEYPVYCLIDIQVTKDLELIEKALKLIAFYEKKGVEFNFINYKTTKQERKIETKFFTKQKS